MAKQITITIQESVEELNRLILKQVSINKRQRLKMLLLIKEGKVVYTQELVGKLKYCRKTIYNWLNKYESQGLSGLLAVEKGGNNTPLLSESTKIGLEKKLSDPLTNITSYKALLNWVHTHHQDNVTYGALYKHCRVHLKSRLKVSRKFHHKKDEQAVDAFKKTTGYTRTN